MEVSFLRLYLLSGLLAHKAVWEILKRRQPVPQTPKARTPKTRLLSAAKIVILAAIVVQSVSPEFLPIMRDPAQLRILGAALYTLGVLMALTARFQLGRNWSDIEKSLVMQNHGLVTHGLYRWVRHPIYAGDVLLLLGLELALNSWAAAGVVALAVYVRGQAMKEEQALLQSLPGYDQYCRRTARFLPFLQM
jgi:protein-S-isoprenylcysteine O-methyltransferase Ste14